MGIFSQVSPPTFKTLNTEIEQYLANGTRGQYITNMIKGNEGKGLQDEEIIDKMMLEFYKEATVRYFRLSETPQTGATIPLQQGFSQQTVVTQQGTPHVPNPLGNAPVSQTSPTRPMTPRVPNPLAQPVQPIPTRDTVATPVRTLDDIINKRPMGGGVQTTQTAQSVTPVSATPPMARPSDYPFGITDQATDDNFRPFSQLLSYSGDAKPYLLGKEFYNYVRETYPNFSQISDETKVILPHFKTPNDISTNSFISMDFRTLEEVLKDKLEYVTEDGSEFTHDGFIDQLPIDYNFVVNIFMGGDNPQDHNEFMISPVLS